MNEYLLAYFVLGCCTLAGFFPALAGLKGRDMLFGVFFYLLLWPLVAAYWVAIWTWTAMGWVLGKVFGA